MNAAYTALGAAYKALRDAPELESDPNLFSAYVGARNLHYMLGQTCAPKNLESEPKPSPPRALEELLCEAVDKAESVTITMNRAGVTVETFSTPCEVRKTTVRDAVNVLLRKLRSAA